MKLISHRGLWTGPHRSFKAQNSLPAFAASQQDGFGVETDLRSLGGKLYLSHDLIKNTDQLVSLEQLLTLWSSTPELPLFLNIKEDGLLPLLAPYKAIIDSLSIVFFDMSIPELIQYSKIFSKSQLATRMSDYELKPSAEELCDWLWVDGFSKDFEPTQIEELLQEKKFKVALVSSELHHRNPRDYWALLKTISKESLFQLTLCTDFPRDAARIFS